MSLSTLLSIPLVGGGGLSALFGRPQRITFPKASRWYRLALPWDLRGGHRRVRFKLVRRCSFKWTLRSRLSRWGLRGVLGRVIYLWTTLPAAYVRSGARIGRVYLNSHLFSACPNLVCLTSICASPVRVRRKALSFIVKRFGVEQKRLWPLRRIHRVKRRV